MTAETQTIERILDMTQGLYLSLRSSLAAQWMHVDYTMPQLKVLLFLYTDGDSRMTDLAAALRTSLPAATGIVDRLVDRGLVLRANDPADRRVVVCCLSAEGRRQISELWEGSFDTLRSLLAPLPQEHLEAIARGVEIMLKAAEEWDKGQAASLSRGKTT